MADEEKKIDAPMAPEAPVQTENAGVQAVADAPESTSSE